MSLLRKALIQCPSKTELNQGYVIGITEVSEKGFGKLRADIDQLYWDCTRWAVQPGDIFKDGIFYTQADPSVQVEYVPSTEEKLASVEADFTEKDLDNKMAIAEVYEMLLGEGGVV